MGANESDPPPNANRALAGAAHEKTGLTGGHLTIPGLLVKHAERFHRHLWQGHESAKDVIRSILERGRD